MTLRNLNLHLECRQIASSMPDGFLKNSGISIASSEERLMMVIAVIGAVMSTALVVAVPAAALLARGVFPVILSFTAGTLLQYNVFCGSRT